MLFALRYQVEIFGTKVLIPRGFELGRNILSIALAKLVCLDRQFILCLKLHVSALMTLKHYQKETLILCLWKPHDHDVLKTVKVSYFHDGLKTVKVSCFLTATFSLWHQVDNQMSNTDEKSIVEHCCDVTCKPVIMEHLEC